MAVCPGLRSAKEGIGTGHSSKGIAEQTSQSSSLLWGALQQRVSQDLA